MRTFRFHHLLVVDDSPDNLLLMEVVLRDAGYAVETATDGYSALDQVRRSPPRLILLDLMMPGIDGCEVIRRIHQDPKLPSIPIILTTAYGYFDAEQAIASGANSIVYKPIDIDELLNKVEFCLNVEAAPNNSDLVCHGTTPKHSQF